MQIDTPTRLMIAGLVFVVFALWEVYWPQRQSIFSRSRRWSGNLGLFVADLLLIGIPLQGIALGTVVLAETNSFGLMNWLQLPWALKAVIGFLALDAMFYFQHRLSHAVPLLWRLHRVHHADTEMDVSTANRVHPLESLWLTFLRVVLAVSLGIPLLVLIGFQIALNIVSLFNHANIELPASVDRVIRRVFVTPNMHETHHSAHTEDYDTNFSFIFSFWDRVFRTYKRASTPVDGIVRLGLDEFRSEQDASLGRLLLQPFRN